MQVKVDEVIDTQSVVCCPVDGWKLVIALCSCEEPYENLVFVKMADSMRLFPEMEHVVEKNKLVVELYNHIIKSNDELVKMCGNRNCKEYRIIFARILYDLALKEDDVDADAETKETVAPNNIDEYKATLITDVKQQMVDRNMETEERLNDVTIEIPDDILQRMFDDSKKPKQSAYDSFVESVEKSCQSTPFINKTVNIMDGKYTVTTIAYRSNYETSGDKYAYVYIKVHNNENNLMVYADFEVVAYNDVVIAILTHIAMTDEELKLTHTSPLVYRRKLCNAIQLLWD